MGTTVLLLLQICSYFDMRETSCCLFLTTIKQMLLKHLTLPLDDLLNIDNPYFAQMVSQIYFTVHSSFAIILKRKRKLVTLMHCLTDVLLL